ncbi:hypothetical protein MPEAHAMD_5902 [Methylobacterium frigidaeris]|uniref:Uncharacterized protein n=1 Tax=Methylobacterium frigidaeris TaxID=2038277 RepID=A0AA37M828_9HYPH|nr:hypothetical protein MPEAHAMD_5902 [Methylobacterium frigidaeris]
MVWVLISVYHKLGALLAGIVEDDSRLEPAAFLARSIQMARSSGLAHSTMPPKPFVSASSRADVELFFDPLPLRIFVPIVACSSENISCSGTRNCDKSIGNLFCKKGSCARVTLTRIDFFLQCNKHMIILIITETLEY